MIAEFQQVFFLCYDLRVILMYKQFLGINLLRAMHKTKLSAVCISIACYRADRRATEHFLLRVHLFQV